MALTPGTRLGPYEIIAQIGEGGMGQVFRARDTKLDRDVAIKILPEAFAHDADRLARFTREAKTLASLNHPHIAAIYGLEDFRSGGSSDPPITALVMEFVEGDDLSQRIARGAIPLDDALPIARQIAEALEAAHEQGIIHRDLKPANIKVRADGTVKVLDFGLAKAMDVGAGGTGRPGGAGGDVSQSPTITTPAMTLAGMILGTAAYMAPEQARGRAVDKRADIWAFGCVLFEMLTARRAFQGSDVSETIANIIKAEPEWTALPADVPAAVPRVLRRCLEKEPTRRLRDIGDAWFELEDSLASPAELTARRPAAQPAPARSKTVLAATAVLLALLGAAVGVGWSALRGRTAPAQQPVYLSIPPPGGPLGIRVGPVVSPDGRQLAFWAPDSAGVAHLWVRSINEPAARSLTGTKSRVDSTGSRPVAWSPDGRSLAFLADGKLFRIDLAGGSPFPLADAGISPRGLAWSSEGVILYVPNSSGAGIYRVASAGGTPQQLKVGANPAAAEWPVFLPDGRHFLFYVSPLQADASQVGIYAGSLDSAEAVRVSTVRSRPDYTAGHLFFVRDDTLFAQAFDPVRLTTAGEPFRVADGIGAVGGDVAAYAFSVSAAGTIAFSDAPFLPTSRFTWLDRSGNIVGALGEPSSYFSFALSADEQSVVAEKPAGAQSPTTNLWAMSRGSGALSLLTLDGTSPVWDTKNNFLIYQVSGMKLARRQLQTDREEPLRTPDLGGRPWPEDVSRDGRLLLFRVETPASKGDIWAMPLDGGAPPAPYINTRANEYQARVSPDGRWVAYASDESGREDVFVQAFPEPRLKQRVSTSGGIRPLWSRDGRELFYLDPANRFMGARVTASSEGLTVSTPAPLFTIAGLGSASNFRQQIAASASGDRFLFNLLVPQPRPTTLTVILNWNPPLH